jgi:hypothetical protein
MHPNRHDLYRHGLARAVAGETMSGCAGHYTIKPPLRQGRCPKDVTQLGELPDRDVFSSYRNISIEC